VLTPPPDLDERRLRAVLAEHWHLTATTMDYRPVGFGSHHWRTVDAADRHWFVTVDELEHKRHREAEPLSVAFARLRAALATSIDLRDALRHAPDGASPASTRPGSTSRPSPDGGHLSTEPHGTGPAVDFVSAPEATREGEPAAGMDERFGVAVYPFIEGRSFEFDGAFTVEHRAAILDLLVAVHTAPPSAGQRAMVDDFTVPHRDALEAALQGAGVPDHGPYTRATSNLVLEHAGPIRRLLERYDTLAARSPTPRVLTHGEPHPGNTMLTAHGWILIDWDTALLAPPERDLWSLDPGDGSILAAYAEATGVSAQPAALELYRLSWDLAELAVDVARFRRRHTGNRDDDACWHNLSTFVAGLT
jgi:aminoglycoside phosphotransferase (APT) family kinase protein